MQANIYYKDSEITIYDSKPNENITQKYYYFDDQNVYDYNNNIVTDPKILEILSKHIIIIDSKTWKTIPPEEKQNPNNYYFVMSDLKQLKIYKQTKNGSYRLQNANHSDILLFNAYNPNQQIQGLKEDSKKSKKSLRDNDPFVHYIWDKIVQGSQISDRDYKKCCDVMSITCVGLSFMEIQNKYVKNQNWLNKINEYTISNNAEGLEEAAKELTQDITLLIKECVEDVEFYNFDSYKCINFTTYCKLVIDIYNHYFEHNSEDLDDSESSSYECTLLKTMFGQFRTFASTENAVKNQEWTPHAVSEFMIGLFKNYINDSEGEIYNILEPCTGGGNLVYPFSKLYKNPIFKGDLIDPDRNVLQITYTALMMQKQLSYNCHICDFFDFYNKLNINTNQNINTNIYDFAVTNPPFSDKYTFGKHNLFKFIDYCMNISKYGCFLIPTKDISGNVKSLEERGNILQTCDILDVYNLGSIKFSATPQNVVVLFLRKGKSSEPIKTKIHRLEFNKLIRTGYTGEYTDDIISERVLTNNLGDDWSEVIKKNITTIDIKKMLINEINKKAIIKFGNFNSNNDNNTIQTFNNDINLINNTNDNDFMTIDLNQLFVKVSGPSKSSKDALKYGMYPLIGSSKFNKGKGETGKEKYFNTYDYESGLYTINKDGSVGYIFKQDEPFCINCHVNVMQINPLYENILNNLNLYLISLQLNSKFSFTNSLNYTNFNNTKVILINPNIQINLDDLYVCSRDLLEDN